MPLRGEGSCGGGEGERVLALESREGTRASRRVEEGLTLPTRHIKYTFDPSPVNNHRIVARAE